jgi:hypothetical protein
MFGALQLDLAGDRRGPRDLGGVKLDRGADALVSNGQLGEAAADALKDEARRRAQRGEVLRPHRVRQHDRHARRAVTPRASRL